VEVSEKTRLEKLLGMLGSSFDGERANAARMIANMAEKKRMTITELIYGSAARADTHQAKPEQPAASRAQSNTILRTLRKIISADIADLDFVLTDWECEFATSVAKQYSHDYQLSEKQIVIAEKIIRKVELARAAR